MVYGLATGTPTRYTAGDQAYLDYLKNAAKSVGVGDLLDRLIKDS